MASKERSLRQEFFPPPTRHLLREEGRAVSIFVPVGGEKLLLTFQKRLGREDVVNGKLVSALSEKIKRRGGKRHMTLSLSYESAEMLFKVLKTALRDARRRRCVQTVVWKTFLSIDVFARNQERRERFRRN